MRLYGAYKEEGNLAVDVSFLIDPEGFVGDVCNFLVGKPLILYFKLPNMVPTWPWSKERGGEKSK